MGHLRDFLIALQFENHDLVESALLDIVTEAEAYGLHEVPEYAPIYAEMKAVLEAVTP